MQEAVVNKIKSKIAHCKFGEVFFVSSFPQYDVEYVTKLLAIFEKEGVISRISKGVYVKARKTRFGILYPSASELASEIAKRDKAVIIPTGVTAANLLAENPETGTIEHDLLLAPVWMRNIIRRNIKDKAL